MTTEQSVPKKNNSKISNWQKVILFLIFILFAASIYNFWIFYCTSQQINAAFKHLNSSQTTLSQQIETLTTENQNHAQLKTQVEMLQKQINAVPFFASNYPALLMKAQYALELAQFHAQWSYDSATTIALLKQANSYLAESSNADLFAVREALAHDIVAQESAAKLDIVNILSQLNAIETQVQDCPYRKPLSTAKTPTQESPTPNSWHDRLLESTGTLKQFFIVRHHTDPIQPFLTPAYQTVQKEIIRFNLQEAEWAVLQRNNALYKIALKKALENVKRAFDQQNVSANQIIEHLAQLQKIELQTTKIIPTESLILLQKVISQLSQPGTQP